MNCVTLHLVGYILEYSYDARTHERLIVQLLVTVQNSKRCTVHVLKKIVNTVVTQLSVSSVRTLLPNECA